MLPSVVGELRLVGSLGRVGENLGVPNPKLRVDGHGTLDQVLLDSARSGLIRPVQPAVGVVSVFPATAAAKVPGPALDAARTEVDRPGVKPFRRPWTKAFVDVPHPVVVESDEAVTGIDRAVAGNGEIGSPRTTVMLKTLANDPGLPDGANEVGVVVDPVRAHAVDQQRRQLLVLGLNGLEVRLRNTGSFVESEGGLDMDGSEAQLEEMRDHIREMNRPVTEGGPCGDSSGASGDQTLNALEGAPIGAATIGTDTPSVMNGRGTVDRDLATHLVLVQKVDDFVGQSDAVGREGEGERFARFAGPFSGEPHDLPNPGKGQQRLASEEDDAQLPLPAGYSNQPFDRPLGHLQRHVSAVVAVEMGRARPVLGAARSVAVATPQIASVGHHQFEMAGKRTLWRRTGLEPSRPMDEPFGAEALYGIPDGASSVSSCETAGVERIPAFRCGTHQVVGYRVGFVEQEGFDIEQNPSAEALEGMHLREAFPGLQPISIGTDANTEPHPCPPAFSFLIR